MALTWRRLGSRARALQNWEGCTHKMARVIEQCRRVCNLRLGLLGDSVGHKLSNVRVIKERGEAYARVNGFHRLWVGCRIGLTCGSLKAKHEGKGFKSPLDTYKV
jgi:hypothetical protein